MTQRRGDVRSEATDSSLLARGDDVLVTSHSTTSKCTVPHYERSDVMLAWSEGVESSRRLTMLGKLLSKVLEEVSRR